MLDTSTVLFALVLGLGSIIFFQTTSQRDPYGLYHLALNKDSKEDPDSLPKTEWMNQGYWKVRFCLGLSWLGA